MFNSALLCKEFYEVLYDSYKGKASRLTFSPDHADVVTKFFVSESENNVEIVCFKSTYLLIFKEAHEYFKKYQIMSASPKNWDTYYSSLGYLLTTPENKTNFNVHFDTFLKLLSENDPEVLLIRELEVIQILLTSSNNRLNKSSSLWQLYRKLYALSLKFKISSEHDYISTFLDSGGRHLSNYYCWNTARWFFDIFPVSQKEEMIEQAQNFCFRSFKDSSSWDALSYMVCQSKRKIDYNFKDFLHLQDVLNSSRELTPQEFTYLHVEGIFKAIVKLIDSFTVGEWPPFLCCLAIASQFPELHTTDLITRWKLNVSTFEQRYGPIQSIRNNPTTPREYADDFLVYSVSKHIGYKKRFLEIFEIAASEH